MRLDSWLAQSWGQRTNFSEGFERGSDHFSSPDMPVQFKMIEQPQQFFAVL